MTLAIEKLSTSKQRGIPMTSTPFSNVLTIIFVLIDDWYKTIEWQIPNNKVGRKPSFSNREMLTLMIAHDFIPYPSETQYIEHMCANYLDMFPKFLNQSQFYRRARSPRFLMEEFRRY